MERESSKQQEQQLIMYRGNPIRLLAGFFNRNFTDQEWHDLSKVLKGENF